MGAKNDRQAELDQFCRQSHAVCSLLQFSMRGVRAVLLPRCRFLNDVNEENDPPGLRRSRGNQVKASLQTVNLCIHGLVLLNQLIN